MNKFINNKSDFCVIAGPCSVESYDQLARCAEILKENNLSWMRCGVFKPRVSPYDFQGLGLDGLSIIEKIKRDFDICVITEILKEEQIDTVMDVCDAIQIGTRNMTNYELLRSIGHKTSDNKFPILFKRGMSAKISEFLSTCEYITMSGNDNVMLCERGIRTFEDSTRFTLDITSIPVIKKQSSLNMCVDVSHACGRSDIVPSAALAVAACGADALMLEVHPNPKVALCDGTQQINLEEFSMLLNNIEKICLSMGKKVV